MLALSIVLPANGTDAMSLVLMAWDIKEDAVFIPDFTFCNGRSCGIQRCYLCL